MTFSSPFLFNGRCRLLSTSSKGRAEGPSLFKAFQNIGSAWTGRNREVARANDTIRSSLFPIPSPGNSRSALVALILVREARSDEAFEERVWRVGFGSEFRMELAGKKPGMILDFDELDQSAIG